MITSRAIPGQLPEALRRLSASYHSFAGPQAHVASRVMSRPTKKVGELRGATHPDCNRRQPYGWNVLVYSILVRKSALNP